MKKILTITMVILSVLFITACTKENKNNKMQTIKYTHSPYGTIKFSYPRSMSFSVNEKEYDESHKSLILINHDFSLEMDLNLVSISKEEFDEYKKLVSKTIQFKEYTYNGYETYTYGNDDDFQIRMKLREESTGYTVCLEGIISIANGQSTPSNLKNAFAQKGIQDFFNSIEYKE